jgi:nicotinate-nucleotide adenylyltransferase
MRIAFFGGTFDPPHRGHLAIARAAAERLQLDRVWFAPVGLQPLKQDSSVASFEDRMAMVQLAIAGDARFEASTVDAPRTDGQPNYTIDTLARMKDSLSPTDRLFCLVGADSFLILRHWYKAAELLFVCDFIVAGRPGFDLQQTAESLPAGVHVAGEPRPADGLTTLEIVDNSEHRSTLHILPDLQEDVSATEIREALAEGATEDRVLAAPVASYIRAHKLYVS